MALAGYINPLLLMIVVAHVGIVIFACFNPTPGLNSMSRCLGWLIGCGLSVLLLWPLFGYFAEVSQFARAHRDYLFQFGDLRLLNLLAHNGTFLIALVIVSIAAYVVRQIQSQEAPDSTANETSVAPAPVAAADDEPLPDAPEL